MKYTEQQLTNKKLNKCMLHISLLLFFCSFLYMHTDWLTHWFDYIEDLLYVIVKNDHYILHKHI